MKVACVITGLPRNVQEGYDFFWKKLIQWYDADVFLHYWETDDWQNVEDIYHPKASYHFPPGNYEPFQVGIEAEDNSSNYDERFRVGGYFRGLPLFDGWAAGASLVFKEAIKMSENDQQYDMVIRGRYDLFNPDIDLYGLDLTKINVSAHNWPNSPICDDNLMVCNQTNFLRLHCGIFKTLIENIEKYKRIYFQEKSLTNIIELKDLTHLIHKSPLLKFQFIRDVLKQVTI